MLYARIAPTPSGYLHYGNALNFVLTWVYARYYNAKLGLRIDDLDPFRYKDIYVKYIFDTLEWLDISWDEPPFGFLEFKAKYQYVYREKEYREFLLHVKEKPWTYVCVCSRKDFHNPSHQCRCKTKNLPLEPFKSALKLNINALEKKSLFGVELSEINDPVLWRKEDIPSYHLASLFDDSLKGRCLLVRGEDLKETSATQLLLAKALGMSDFENSIFIHHPLVLDDLGCKLSKTRNSPAVDLSQGSEKLFLDASKLLSVEPAYSAQSILEAFGIKQKSLGLGFDIGGEK